ncbi:MAG: 30S ribosomal protein S5 [Candidatus Micrarchaeaceae archaeon]
MKKKQSYEPRETFNIDAWQPKTEVGKRVKLGEIKSIEQIFHEGKRISENGIVEALLPNIKSEVIEIMNVQRMTKNNRKMKFRVVAVVGDGNGHAGIGVGKDAEIKAAIDQSISNAKRNIVPIIMGCGSWQCKCGTEHSLPLSVSGKCGSVEVFLKPAPRGLGVVASEPVKKLVELAGIKDAWSFSRGRTRARYNTLVAAMRALTSTNGIKNVKSLNLGSHKEFSAEAE